MLFEDRKDNNVFIQGLFVEEEYRHKGIAKGLVSEAESYSKSIGRKNITAEARSNLLRFYGGLGFSVAGRKNDWTFMISKSLERDKQIEDDEELEY